MKPYKEYNRKTKKWEEKTTEQVGDLKREKLCKGKRPHHYELVLPPFIASKIDESSLSQGHIEKYYELLDKQMESRKYYDDLICNLLGTNAVGILNGKVYRWWVCVNCDKKK